MASELGQQVRYQFLLNQNYPEDEASRISQHQDQVRGIQKEAMLSELRSRGNTHRLTAVQDESTLYSEEYRRTLLAALDRGVGLQESCDLAAITADTVTALSDTGNPSRPVAGHTSGGNPAGEFQMAIAGKLYPNMKIKERHFNKIRKIMSKLFQELKDEPKPHILECTWIRKFLYVRLVCGDRKTIDWMEQILPQLHCWQNASLRVIEENTLRQTGVYKVSLPNTPKDSIEQIARCFRLENPGFTPTRWKMLSRQLCDDQTTLQLLLKVPDVPDEALLKDVGYSLSYKSQQVSFIHADAEAIEDVTQACAAYSAQFPDVPGDTPKDVLRMLQDQNDGLVTSEWTIGKTDYFLRNQQRVMRIAFIVDAASEETIKRANRQLYYRQNRVNLHPEPLQRQERYAAKAAKAAAARPGPSSSSGNQGGRKRPWKH